MVADYSLECKKDGRMSAARIGWVVYAILMMMIYTFGIPAMFTVLLWKSRVELCPELKSKGIRHIIVRDSSWEEGASKSHADDHMLAFLASAYLPAAFWFEIVECYRRLCLSSMLILVADGSAMQIVFAIFMCLFSIKVFSHYAPFATAEDNILAEVAQ